MKGNFEFIGDKYSNKRYRHCKICMIAEGIVRGGALFYVYRRKMQRRAKDCLQHANFNTSLKPVQVTYMDLGITDIDGIVKLPAKGIYQGKDPGTGGKVHPCTEPERVIA